MKIFFVIIGVALSAIFLYLNMFFPVPGHWVFTVFMVCATIVKIAESFYSSKENDATKYQGDWTLLLTSLLYFITGVFIIGEFYFLNTVHTALSVFAGILIYLFAVILRYWSIKTLGNQWAIHIVMRSKLKATHKLVLSGPYKYIRHPIYLTYILDLIGISLIFGTYYSMILIVVLNIPSYVLRAMYEEKISRIRFASEYDEYFSVTSFMLPTFFINKK
ncbi:MAG: isoprenylcysteine carboxylmethyltransferase family protein [Candidatus Paceibacterota bacterium]|jgi:protein-S-isoprenylcysteine O-methyltransferase Ste14